MADGLSLAKTMVNRQDLELEGILKEYEHEMGPRATEAVLSSRMAHA